MQSMTVFIITSTLLIFTIHCTCIDANKPPLIKCNPENSSLMNSNSESTHKFNDTHTQKVNMSFAAVPSGPDYDNITDAPEVPWKTEYPEKKLPLAIIIAGPTAAVFVILFLCIAFYFHNLQLNKKTARLSLTLYVTQDSGSETCEGEAELPVVTKIETTPPEIVNITRNLSVQSVRLSVDNSALPPLHLARENSSQSMRRSMDSELFLPPRKSAISLGLPSRGSTLSAFADQEIVNQSAKRKKHSIFFI